MLNQIVHTGAMLPDISNQLTHNIQLVETRENKNLIILAMDEFLNDVQGAILLQHILPQICRGIAIGVGRVTLAAVITGTV